MSDTIFPGTREWYKLEYHRLQGQLADREHDVAEAHKREVRLCDRLGGANMKLLLSEQARQSLREAELQKRFDNLTEQQVLKSQDYSQIKQERDAALSVLEIARKGLLDASEMNDWGASAVANKAFLATVDYTAALAERDRAIVERCIELAHNTIAYESWFEMATRRFGLEPKTEGK